jgi:hypothetical protein
MLAKIFTRLIKYINIEKLTNNKYNLINEFTFVSFEIACPQGYDYINGVCLQQCASGYIAVATNCVAASLKQTGCGTTQQCILSKCIDVPNVCTDSNCPRGYTGTGVICVQIKADSYSRNIQIAGFQPCCNGSTGIGSVCVAQSCANDLPYLCGGALCMKSETTCLALISSSGMNMAIAATNIMALFASGGVDLEAFVNTAAATGSLAANFMNPPCPNPVKDSTSCVRKFATAGNMSQCSGPSSFECGILCTSSEIHCAKLSLQLLSIVGNVVGAYVGDDAHPAVKNVKSLGVDKVMIAFNYIKATISKSAPVAEQASVIAEAVNKSVDLSGLMSSILRLIFDASSASGILF